MRACLAALLIGAVLTLPPGPLPLELAAVFFLMRLRALRPLLLALLMAVVLLRLGDAGMRAAFARPFDLLTDWGLLGAGWSLAVESVGGLRAGLAVGAAVLALIGLGFALRWALARRVPMLPVLALALILPVGLPVLDLAQDRLAAARQTLADLRSFRLAARVDPFDGAAGALGRLAGHDAAIIFVESYGRASFDNPLYAAHPETLLRAEGDLRRAGLAMRSGWLTSPVAGGQSWLAHATLLSGLRIADQGRYRALLQSPRRTLLHLAAGAGLHPLAVMPAITLDWPEGEALGFAEILDAEGMGYRGKSLGWVTMPDQYTLSVLERRLRAPGDVFAGVALISSHAPWVPVIGMRDWADLGDGSGFDGGWDSRTPAEVWARDETIRDQYGRSVDYALRAVTEFAARQADDPPLLVILGDHQPARFVAGAEGRDVPVHVIGPPDLIAHLDGWGWSDGLIPAHDLLSWPMETFRDRYLNAFTEGAGHLAH